MNEKEAKKIAKKICKTLENENITFEDGINLLSSIILSCSEQLQISKEEFALICERMKLIYRVADESGTR